MLKKLLATVVLIQMFFPCVEAYDALSGLKSFEELEAKINAGWEKNEF